MEVPGSGSAGERKCWERKCWGVEVLVQSEVVSNNRELEWGSAEAVGCEGFSLIFWDFFLEILGKKGGI